MERIKIIATFATAKTEKGRFKNLQRGRGKIKGHHPANNHLPTTFEKLA